MSTENLNKINDDTLEQVSGGAANARGSYSVAKNGDVVFNGKDNKELKISAAEWSWLKTQYNDPNPEEFIKTVPAKDIATLLQKHQQA